jgi:monoterpene epsilon-lactone hydrolase
MLPRSHGTPAEWSGTGGQPSYLYATTVYYLFNIVFWFLTYICRMGKRQAIEQIFATCKRLQTKSLTVIRQPVLALISPPTDNINYQCIWLSGGPSYYTVEPARGSKTMLEIIYIHGGGCISGDFAGYKGFCERIANEIGAQVHFVNYRLAPEADICDAVEDVIKVHQMIAATAATTNICWMADSGGGVIALNAISRLLSEHKKIHIPSKCVLLSPVTDLTCSTESFKNNVKTDVMLDADVTRWVLALACCNISKDQSPIRQIFPNCTSGSGSSRPEFYIYVGAKEILADDSILIANKLHKAGYTVNLEVNPWGFHSWPLLWRYVPEADQTVREICSVLQTGAVQI